MLVSSFFAKSNVYDVIKLLQGSVKTHACNMNIT